MAAIHRVVKMPFSRIVKIGVWSNQSSKTTMTAIYNTLQKMYPGKEIYIQNGGFFNMDKTLAALWGLKANGVTYSGNWPFSGFIAMKGKDITFFPEGTTACPVQYTDAVTGYPVLIENGVKSLKYHTAPDGKSDRGRSMIGYTGTHLIMSTISDVSGSTDYTLGEELNYMLSLGCKYAINLDGGGSAQCNFNGAKIISSRKVSNFVYMVAEPDDVKTEIQAQRFLNATYGQKLTVDGILGALTNKAIKIGMQTECGVVADGIWGAKSNAAFKTLAMNSLSNTPNKIKLVQCALCRKKYWDMPINGEFDNALYNQICLFQRANKLTANGQVDANTWKALIK